MTKAEKQKLALAVIGAGYKGTGVKDFEDILDIINPELEYYNNDIGYMVGFSQAVLESKNEA